MNPGYKDYLGDSVYATWDGYCITLTTENGIAASNVIVLEPDVLAALHRFEQRVNSSPNQIRMEEMDASNFEEWAHNQTLGDLQRTRNHHIKDPIVVSDHAVEILSRVIKQKEAGPDIKIVPSPEGGPNG